MLCIKETVRVSYLVSVRNERNLLTYLCFVDAFEDIKFDPVDVFDLQLYPWM